MFARRRLRRELIDRGFLPEWRELLARQLRHWNRLTEAERGRLEELTLDLMATKRWESARDFELTEEMRVLIASQAALLILGLPDDSYRKVTTIIVHPTGLVMEGEHSLGGGLVSDEPMPVIGLADHSGPVVIAWDAALASARHARGHNVVFHEFAHHLDLLDGTVDGTPPIADPAEFERWVEVCTRVYEQVAHGRGGRSLDPYAGVNVGEFFAVATEAFFDDPAELHREHFALYEVLRDFYRQDPIARVRL